MLLWPEKSSASFYWPLAAAAAPPIMLATSRQLSQDLVLGLHLLLQELDPFLLLLHLSLGTLLRLKSGGSVLEQFLLPAVEHRWAQTQFFTELRDWHFVHKMPPQDGYFFFRGEMLPFLPHTFAPLS